MSLGRVGLEAELDEQWSYVGSKSNPRWLWYAVDHQTNTALAYECHLKAEQHRIDKQNTQKIERKNLN